MGWTTGGIPDEEFGGNHAFGTGTYEARTPEQAAALYAQLPKGDGTPPPEPPLSTTGKSYYETNNWTGSTTDPRVSGGDDNDFRQGWGARQGGGVPSQPGRWGSDGTDAEGDPDNDEESLGDFAVSNTFFGRILKLFGR